jgi:cytoskeletal protein CcmA (bactofilin family)
MRNRKHGVNPNRLDTLIGENTEFHGMIKSQASIRVEGRIIGDIECAGDVTIGENGYAKSKISTRNIDIFGTVLGEVISRGRLNIKSTGKLLGNHTSAFLSIEKGGVILGVRTLSKSDEINKNEDSDQNDELNRNEE